MVEQRRRETRKDGKRNLRGGKQKGASSGGWGKEGGHDLRSFRISKGGFENQGVLMKVEC